MLTPKLSDAQNRYYCIFARISFRLFSFNYSSIFEPYRPRPGENEDTNNAPPRRHPPRPSPPPGPWTAFPPTGPHRARFLCEAVADLRGTLRAHGSDLVPIPSPSPTVPGYVGQASLRPASPTVLRAVFCNWGGVQEFCSGQYHSHPHGPWTRRSFVTCSAAAAVYRFSP